jgi:hypothetical protein
MAHIGAERVCRRAEASGKQSDMILAFPKGAPPQTAQELNSQFRGLPAAHYTNYSVTNPHDGEFIGYTFCS